jgi:hypothetical protein
VSKKGPCPICGKTCDVAANGRSGFCNSTGKPWKVEMRPVADLKAGPIRHKALPKGLLKPARWTYAVVGRFVQPTFEQWELTFLRDLRPERELAIWCKIANAYLAFLAARGRDPQAISLDDAKPLLGALLAISMAAEPKPTAQTPPETIAELKEYYENAAADAGDGA